MLQHGVQFQLPCIGAIMYNLVSFVCLSLCFGFVLLAILPTILEGKSPAVRTEEYVSKMLGQPGVRFRSALETISIFTLAKLAATSVQKISGCIASFQITFQGIHTPEDPA